LSQNTDDSKLSYGENPKSLSNLVLKRYRIMTDGRTNEQTDRENYHSALLHVKMQSWLHFPEP